MKCSWTKSDEHKAFDRCHASPTGRYKFDSILVDSCPCGWLTPVYSERLNYKQRDWVARWNKRAENKAEELVKEAEKKSICNCTSNRCTCGKGYSFYSGTEN